MLFNAVIRITAVLTWHGIEKNRFSARCVRLHAWSTMLMAVHVPEYGMKTKAAFFVPKSKTAKNGFFEHRTRIVGFPPP
jgi:hypothetical protein